MSEVKEERSKPSSSLLIRGAIWIAIGALIAAALVCVIWVLIGDQNGLIGRAFLTILLLAAFAGIAILEAGLAPRRPDWLALASMITWIVALIAGAIKIWLPEQPYEYASGVGRFFMLLLIVGVLQLALLHVRLFTPAAQRYVTTFTRVIYYVTIAMLVLLALMLVIYLTLPDTFMYGDLYWRIVVALAILTAVGTMLIPLLNALFAPKKHPVAQGYAPAIAAPATFAAPQTQQWPTYGDGVTPLPVLADGSPDWNAYYTGIPTQQAPVQKYYTREATFPTVPEQDSAAPYAPQSAPQATEPEVPEQAQPPVPLVPEQAQPPVPLVPEQTQPPVPPVPEQTQPPVPPVPEQQQQPAAPEQPPTAPPAPGAFPPPPPAPRP
ncbi:hypothetical protein [Microbacterium sp.]|uniref:hypothetical protein n=1 Tax=Microbacterium sp. TaxID=51671 RepID=UPI003F9E6A02